MQKFINDLKTCAVITWPTSEKEYKKNPVFQFRTLKENDVNVGDSVEVQSQDKMKNKPAIFYKIEQILEKKESKAFPNMMIYECKFIKEVQPLFA